VAFDLFEIDAKMAGIAVAEIADAGASRKFHKILVL
jgi:hypothetical protein